MNPADKFASGYSDQVAKNFISSMSIYFEQAQPDVDRGSGVELGILRFPNGDKVPVFGIASSETSDRGSRKKQYDQATKITADGLFSGFSMALFFFHDSSGSFRFSLISSTIREGKRVWSSPRRQSFIYLHGRRNKTFNKRFNGAEVATTSNLAEIFSIGQVTDEFYQEFETEFGRLTKSLLTSNPLFEKHKVKDTALLFVIRTIFLGFIQEKGWLGNDRYFLQNSFRRFNASGKGHFYNDFLKVLFLEALNTPSGRRFSGKPRVDDESYLERALTISPYLNGGLFRSKPGFDDQNFDFPNEAVGQFFEFIFSFEFTVEENSPKDEDLQLNPEFLGIIFERIINKQDGAVYTPRTEVDMMSRIAIFKWLCNKVDVDRPRLSKLVFQSDEMPDVADLLTVGEAQECLRTLKSVRVLDPAVGSGAFLVGMLHVISSIEHSLTVRVSPGNSPSSFDRLKEIIGTCLIGVEVREWAVWICQLRLWLAIFIDAPDELAQSLQPILPSLDFRIRTGDSLVQTIGGSLTMPIPAGLAGNKHAKQIERLSSKKTDYYLGRASVDPAELLILEREMRESILLQQIEHLQGEVGKLESASSFELHSLFDDHVVKEGSGKARSLAQLTQLLSHAKDQLRKIDEEQSLVWEMEFSDVFQEKGGFDIVIGNPPYISSTHIEDPLGGLDKKSYANALRETVVGKYPEFFIQNKNKLSGKSDLYAYFYALSLKLLNSEGVHVFICSNTWLDIESGHWLRELLTSEHQLEAVIDNSAKKSFATADVNTVITVTRPGRNVQSGAVVFASVKVPFGDLADVSLVSDQISLTESTSSDSIRSRVAFAEDGANASSLVSGWEIGWGGKFLRSPDLLFQIADTCGHLLTELGHLGSVGGYVHDNLTGDKFPSTSFLKTVKDTDAIWLDESSTGVRAFGVADTPTARKIGQVLIPRTFGLNHLIPVNRGEIAGKEFYRVYLAKEFIETVGVFLNSTFGILQREVLGSAGLGGGALKMAINASAKKFLVPKSPMDLDPELVEEFFRRKVLPVSLELGFETGKWGGVQRLSQVPGDRLAIDRQILLQLGLPEELLEPLYVETANLVRLRDTKSQP